MTDQPYTVAILGSGPGGYVAALRAAQLGAQVVLIEKERVGGTCLNIGCIPTKALTTSTDLLVNTRRAHEFRHFQCRAHLPSLMMYKQSTVDALVGGVEQLLKERKVTLLRGEGHLPARSAAVTDRRRDLKSQQSR
jgi:dihydrolipoamide dehydrogenase